MKSNIFSKGHQLSATVAFLMPSQAGVRVRNVKIVQIVALILYCNTIFPQIMEFIYINCRGYQAFISNSLCLISIFGHC